MAPILWKRMIFFARVHFALICVNFLKAIICIPFKSQMSRLRKLASISEMTRIFRNGTLRNVVLYHKNCTFSSRVLFFANGSTLLCKIFFCKGRPALCKDQKVTMIFFNAKPPCLTIYEYLSDGIWVRIDTSISCTSFFSIKSKRPFLMQHDATIFPTLCLPAFVIDRRIRMKLLVGTSMLATFKGHFTSNILECFASDNRLKWWKTSTSTYSKTGKCDSDNNNFEFD